MVVRMCEREREQRNDPLVERTSCCAAIVVIWQWRIVWKSVEAAGRFPSVYDNSSRTGNGGTCPNRLECEIEFRTYRKGIGCSSNSRIALGIAL